MTTGGWRIGLQSAAHYVPPQWPDASHPQQAHLDLRVLDLAADPRPALRHQDLPEPPGGQRSDRAVRAQDRHQAKMRALPEQGKPAQRGALLHDNDFTIVAKYGSEYAGFVQYYLLAQDVFRLSRLQWVMETSMLKTLAGKHRSTVHKMARKYKTRIESPTGPRRVFQVTVERDRGRKPLVARFGGIPLKRVRTAVLTDQRPVMSSSRRNELIHRLLAGRCEICESTAGLEVHHVRKLADLNKPGRRDKPAWMHLMAMRRRKTLVICRRCHEDIHAGRATTPIRS